MFRRLPSGLPKDPIYPPTLKGLGYFINDKDEIRSIDNPKAYFKFFLTKNDRYNCVQREAMNDVIRNLVADRLLALGLTRIRLPLGAAETESHLPIFISSDLSTKSRVVILFYESTQDLGIFAHRILGGRGGINEGSAVNFVKYIQGLKTEGEDAPGIILANMGQLRWWRRGKKAVTQVSWYSLPQKSCVDAPWRFDEEKNAIPGNRDPAEHIDYIFNHVVKELVDEKANLDIIGVSAGAVQVSIFLENEENFRKWGPRLNAFASIATYYHAHEIKNKAFGEWFLHRGRVYHVSDEPKGTFLAGPDGRRKFGAFGAPVFSLGEPYYAETMLPKGYKTVVDWFQEVAADPNYGNPNLVRYDNDDEIDIEEPMGEGIELAPPAPIVEIDSDDG